MDILQEIISSKYKEVEERMALHPVKVLEKSIFFEAPTVSLKEQVTHPAKSGIIAEIKRKSPSKGIINANVSVEQISKGYIQAGASALSVLTDTKYFGGSSDDLIKARKVNSCPILRKDFTVDEYQIIEAKSIGADAILLIAAALNPVRLKQLTATAHSLNLEVLLEVHNREELDANLDAGADLIGINNRNLKTFVTDVNLSAQLASFIPNSFVKVSESGIENPETIIALKQHGYQGFLMGQSFMQHSNPELACREFITELKRLESKR
ncbi:MAG TPA: indole-3-glycerol phosphate synthase TrpC [Cyclobacteriaceae bacterium]|jgi:indole-3-glycerol phosphate synthase|nr:indole-3-glycerol phosphate synthase TrpC [Cytophagales bacterium]HRE68643.1 indole-3-glycerol phosphate synthase TrpC [Cyclobacteriaceae bacterium]HRF34942.1 indole-3-glycerol phosphate synthase TrpC [Cyclobacteriaceae bacterium]